MLNGYFSQWKKLRLGPANLSKLFWEANWACRCIEAFGKANPPVSPTRSSPRPRIIKSNDLLGAKVSKSIRKETRGAALQRREARGW